MKKNLFNELILVLVTIILSITGCKKFVEVDPPVTSTNEENVFTDDSNAAAVLTGIFATMSNTSLSFSLSVFADLSADNLTLYDLSNVSYLLYYRNSLLADESKTFGTIYFWNLFYPIIYSSNNAIEGVAKSTTLTADVKKRLLGEAYFVRAFCYFYLTNLYGDVPLVISSDYKENATLPKTHSVKVYNQIVSDLLAAEKLLEDAYVDATGINASSERVRPNRSAARALLARVYLYMNRYVDAEDVATQVIDNTSAYRLVPLEEVFVKNSSETIWALQPVKADYNTEEAQLFILPPDGPSQGNPVYISQQLLSIFESEDLRQKSWIKSVTSGETYFYPYKYHIPYGSSEMLEYPVVLRLAEVYLIRAEARVKQNKVSEAQTDLNMVRNRAGLRSTMESNQDKLNEAILTERRAELFTEWGHRWLDLKRVNKINDVMKDITPLKGGTWSPFKALYPIPLYDIKKNPSMTQNIGY
jgi:hypothetical protein